MNLDLFDVVLFFVLVASGLWYYIKYIVHQNGYKTHLFWGYGKDIVNLHQLIKNEQGLTKKSRFKTLLFCFYAALFLAVVSFFVIVVLANF